MYSFKGCPTASSYVYMHIYAYEGYAMILHNEPDNSCPFYRLTGQSPCTSPSYAAQSPHPPVPWGSYAPLRAPLRAKAPPRPSCSPLRAFALCPLCFALSPSLRPLHTVLCTSLHLSPFAPTLVRTPTCTLVHLHLSAP